MANFRNELKSRHASLRRLYDDLRDSSFARLGWNTEVRARRTLGPDATIEHWFLAEHFLVNWSNWAGLLDRFCRYYGQEIDSCPKTWVQLAAKCHLLVYALAHDRALDGAIAESWSDPELTTHRSGRRNGYDIASIYGRIARNHERVEVVTRVQQVPRQIVLNEKMRKLMAVSHGDFGMCRSVVREQNKRLLDHWHELPRRVQDQVQLHLRHYAHSALDVSWLMESIAGVSALPSISWRRQTMSLALEQPAGLPEIDTPISGAVPRLLDRLKTAIAELGYGAVMEDLSSPELVGGEDSLLASDQVMVIPGHLDDASRPILLTVTRGWSGKEPQTFAKVMRQVKTRLIEASGTIQVVVVFCDCWDSASFEEEHREELRAFDKNGVRFVFLLVGVPDSVLIPVPVGFDQAAR